MPPGVDWIVMFQAPNYAKRLNVLGLLATGVFPTILEGKGVPIHPDRGGTGGGKGQGSMPEGDSRRSAITCASGTNRSSWHGTALAAPSK
jgi:hypothetical protein